MSQVSAEPLIRAQGLGLDFQAISVLSGVDLEICPDQHLALRGRSGSGKTSLLLVLAGLLPASSGTITWPGLDAHPRLRRSQIGMVFQAPSLMPELTAEQNVQLPLRLRGSSVEQAREAASTALAAVRAEDLARALPGQLSGGQQQRVAVARVLAGRHRLVLADEPTGALDRAHAFDVVEALINGASAVGASLVLATHDRELVDLFDRHLAMVDGRIASPTAAGRAR